MNFFKSVENTPIASISFVFLAGAYLAIAAIGLADILNAQTAVSDKEIVIDESGEGLSQALKEYYLESSGDEAIALERMFLALENEVFYEDGKIQDLVHIGDRIILDGDGNVSGFEPVSRASRLTDTLGLLDESTVRVGDLAIKMPTDLVSIEAFDNPVDQHTNLLFTDIEGTKYTVIAYGDSGMVFVGKNSYDFVDWANDKFSSGGDRAIATEEISKVVMARDGKIGGLLPFNSDQNTILVIFALLLVTGFIVYRRRNREG